MNAITTCVGYDDLLAITLAKNARHFDLVLVVTTPEDTDTQLVVQQVPNAQSFPTRTFYTDGAKFNKGMALECGLDFGLGRSGWICIFDADTLMPDEMDLSGIRPGFLYSPFRRMCETKSQFYQCLDYWPRLPPGPERLNHEYAGYFQLFHADDAYLPDPEMFPWHGAEFNTAQGCDTIFQNHWPLNCRKRLPFEVLHLGPPKVNWRGRVSPRWD